MQCCMPSTNIYYNLYFPQLNSFLVASILILLPNIVIIPKQRNNQTFFVNQVDKKLLKIFSSTKFVYVVLCLIELTFFKMKLVMRESMNKNLKQLIDQLVISQTKTQEELQRLNNNQNLILQYLQQQQVQQELKVPKAYKESKEPNKDQNQKQNDTLENQNLIERFFSSVNQSKNSSQSNKSNDQFNYETSKNQNIKMASSQLQSVKNSKSSHSSNNEFNKQINLFKEFLVFTNQSAKKAYCQKCLLILQEALQNYIVPEKELQIMNLSMTDSGSCGFPFHSNLNLVINQKVKQNNIIANQNSIQISVQIGQQQFQE